MPQTAVPFWTYLLLRDYLTGVADKQVFFRDQIPLSRYIQGPFHTGTWLLISILSYLWLIRPMQEKLVQPGRRTWVATWSILKTHAYNTHAGERLQNLFTSGVHKIFLLASDCYWRCGDPRILFFVMSGGAAHALLLSGSRSMRLSH